MLLRGPDIHMYDINHQEYINEDSMTSTIMYVSYGVL